MSCATFQLNKLNSNRKKKLIFCFPFQSESHVMLSFSPILVFLFQFFFGFSSVMWHPLLCVTIRFSVSVTNPRGRRERERRENNIWNTMNSQLTKKYVFLITIWRQNEMEWMNFSIFCFPSLDKRANMRIAAMLWSAFSLPLLCCQIIFMA